MSTNSESADLADEMNRRLDKFTSTHDEPVDLVVTALAKTAVMIGTSPRHRRAVARAVLDAIGYDTLVAERDRMREAITTYYRTQHEKGITPTIQK